MRVLDLDMDYFMNEVFTNIPNPSSRIVEEYDGEYVWSELEVRNFLENNLGLSRLNKKPGRVFVHHNEALYFWRELVSKGLLIPPFEVIHVDSHADLGLDWSNGDEFIMKTLLGLKTSERINFEQFKNYSNYSDPNIGDYLLFAIAFRWISKLTYCSNPNGDCSDVLWYTMKDFREPYYIGDHFDNKIQLLYNPNIPVPKYSIDREEYDDYIKSSIAEPDVQFEIIHSIDGVKYNGDFDFVTMAQSPNYTPKSADFIMDIFKEYIEIV